MTKADLVEQVTASIARTAGPMISKKDCARVVDAFLDAIKEALQQQKNIEVRGFGTFKIAQDDAQRAVWSSLGLLAALEALNTRLALPPGYDLAVRLGVHTGAAA